jgi:hypothetical protein
MTTQADLSTSDAIKAATRIADSLEQLVARVHRDLDCDAAELSPIADPYWSRVMEDLVGFARQCERVVTDPLVASVLDAYALSSLRIDSLR